MFSLLFSFQKGKKDLNLQKIQLQLPENLLNKSRLNVQI